ncbi:MAG: hypothetical protein GTN62_10510, partial [Gemmatimonadales bacterium]|nr:hypothetical protein [Gemmatimonadales bacterium]NIN11991.1 hypothetical protein [Gemmatimonadales bacterium]NIN50526.1 hypothetical protein [Gemmatimonadales bacterium]NIP07990.1 hypothetical protein [Gemmatimonadales bacterium]NIR00581.1 hypothetical protein [Gemmatimonadales bacterium]
EPEVLASALRTWQDGKADSAVALFHLASRLQPEDANVPLFMSMMYASQKRLDSASTYLERGIELAGDDPNYRRRKRQAMLELARGHDAVGFESPVTGQIARTRILRDSLERAITRDSAMLAGLIAEWSGKQLRPEVAQAVERDSTMLATRLSSARAALPAAEEALRTDSAAVAQAMGPALRSYEAFLEAFSDDAETALRLLRRYSLVGLGAEMEAMIQRLAGMDEVSVNELTQAGVALYNDSHLMHAVQLLEVATARNPYARNALFMMCRAYYTLQDDAKLAAAAWQLLQVDPLNPQSVRMMAAAWDLAGNRDSTAKYVALADTGIGWAVTITQLVPTASSTIVNGSVANITPHPLPATTLEFDFLDDGGNVMATATMDVPALQPGGRQQITVRVTHGGAAAWRYRRR